MNITEIVIIVIGTVGMILPFIVILYYLLCKTQESVILDFDENLERIVIQTNQNEKVKYKLDDCVKLLEEINREKPHKIIDNNYSKDCSICLEKIEGKICILNCEHSFHFNCIKKWVYEDNSCPECRKIVCDYNI
jgi:hypothetical protein